MQNMSKDSWETKDLRTSAIVDVNFVPEVLYVVVGSDANEATEGVRSESRGGTRDVTRVFQSFVCGVEKHALLRVHALRFTWTYLEKPNKSTRFGL